MLRSPHSCAVAVTAALRTRRARGPPRRDTTYPAVACSPAQLVRPSLFPSPFPSPAAVPQPVPQPGSPAQPLTKIQDGRPCSPAQLTVHPCPGSKMAGPAAVQSPADCTPSPRIQDGRPSCPAAVQSCHVAQPIAMPVPSSIVNTHSSTAQTRPLELCSKASRHLPALPFHLGAGLGHRLHSGYVDLGWAIDFIRDMSWCLLVGHKPMTPK